MIKILIALDGSELAEQALIHGIAIGSSFESRFILLRVISNDANGVHSAIDAVDWQLHRRQAEAYLERQTEKLKAAGLDASWELEEGDAANRLICFAQQNNIDLIILGALGRSGMGQFARGGTVQKVISTATTSVLIAAPVLDQEDPGEMVYRRILVPVDGSGGSQWALNIATAIAQIHDAELILVRAIERTELQTTVPDSRETQYLMEKVTRINRMEAERHMQELQAKLPAGLKVTTEITVTNRAPHAINEIADARDVSLIILSAHSDKHASGWHYGPVPEFLLAHTKRPILVFQHDSGLAASKFRSIYLPDHHAHAS